MSHSHTAPPLEVARLTPAAWSADAGTRPVLGALAYGSPQAGADEVIARVLSLPGPMIDAWSSTGPLHIGRRGCVRWRHNGHWLYGAAQVNEGDPYNGLESLTRDVYRDIFTTLEDTGCRYLQRVWNYLPHINADGGGLERYRQFNSGRQQAFIDVGLGVREGAPAACALGVRGGPFCVRFLAGAMPPVAVENPRQVSAYDYPNAYGPRSPTFSRAALAGSGSGMVVLMISGTASIVGHTSVHVGDVKAQARETVANLQAVVEAAQAHCSARFDLSELDCIIYVRHAESAAAVREQFEFAVGAGSRAARRAVYLEAEICRADLLMEIEAHGVAPGEVRA